MEDKSKNAILIVNDANDQIELMSFELSTAGYQVYTARDGREGYEVARRKRPELVISDVHMPRLNGIELCRLIRTDPQLCTTPIMLVSALRKDDASIIEGLHAGADDYLEAPYDPMRLIAQATRLTERAEVEAYYRGIVEQASDIIYTHDMRGRLITINAAGIRFLNRSREDLIGSHIGEILQLNEPEEWMRQALDDLERRGDRRDYLELTVSQSQRRWLELGLSLIRDRNGHSVGVRGIARDITERRLAEEKVQLLNETLEHRVMERTAQLEEANQELEAFAYSISHDLRTPLRFIASITDLLHQRSASILDDTNLRSLELISGEIKKVVNTIDDLLGFSRAGRAAMLCIAINLDELVQEVKRELQPELDGRLINWKIESLPQVYGDPFMLRIVLQNLLSNSIKYTRPRARAQVEIGSVSTDSEFIFYVRDNGVGFDARLVNKLFSAFQRLHSDEEFEGTGVGLANVRRIINRHGGRTWAEGCLDMGATFYFSLPKSPRDIEALNAREGNVELSLI